MNSIKRHISDVKNSQLRQDLPISINERVILPFPEGFFSRNFAYVKYRKNKVLARISKFTAYTFPVRVIWFLHSEMTKLFQYMYNVNVVGKFCSTWGLDINYNNAISNINLL